MQVAQSQKTSNRTIIELTHSFYQYMQQYGYEWVDLPILEAADLFLIKAGDQVINKLFTFERHGQEWALRPEFTAAAAYHYAKNVQTGVVRWQFSGSIFEDDPNNLSHNHQRFSIGAEIIGMAGTLAEAEIISMAARGLIFRNIQNTHIILGHAGLVRQLLARYKLDNRTQRFLLHHLSDLKKTSLGKAYILEQLNQSLLITSDSQWITPNNNNTDSQPVLNLLSGSRRNNETMGGRTHQDIARRLAQKHQRTAERPQIIAALDFLEEWVEIAGPPIEALRTMGSFINPYDIEAERMLSEWQKLIEMLTAHQIPEKTISIQADLVRSWDYYTGIVFELWADNLHLGGGGRYDELTRLIGGAVDTPAVGFAYYADKLIAALNPSPNIHNEIITLIVEEKTMLAGIAWMRLLQESNIPVQLMTESSDQSIHSTLIVEDETHIRRRDNIFTKDNFADLLPYLKRVVS